MPFHSCYRGRRACLVPLAQPWPLTLTRLWREPIHDNPQHRCDTCRTQWRCETNKRVAARLRSGNVSHLALCVASYSFLLVATGSGLGWVDLEAGMSVIEM